MKKVILTSIALGVLAYSQNAAAQNSKPKSKGKSTKKTISKTTTTSKLGLGKISKSNMDLSVKPGDNFFKYANGSWLKNNPIPATETRWGSFNQLIENTNDQLRTVLEQSKNSSSAQDQLVSKLYQSGMDVNTINAAGITPLKTDLARIDEIRSGQGVLQEIAHWQTLGIPILFYVYVGPDDKNVTNNMVNIGQNGIGLPDRDYYLKDDKRNKDIRAAYQAYQKKVFSMLGYNEKDAAKAAEGVYNLEEKLAKASMDRVTMRDPYKVYNKMSVGTLSSHTRGINWQWMLENMKIKNEDSLLVAQPDYFKDVAKQLSSSNVKDWKNYLKFHVANKMAPYLSANFETSNFQFYGTTLRGQKEQKPRWKRVASVVDNCIGENLGQLYVNKYFQPQAKDRMLQLVDNLQSTYAARIERLDWMSSTTKKKALTKLGTFLKKIGYPNKWKDYSNLSFEKDSYVQNIKNAGAFDYDYMIGKLNREVDKTEWMMSPQTVNAYYNPAFNEIVFPAGILQFPFFDINSDDAVNYGGIGAVIGHEMTHGFDDQGRQYDADGNLKDWWTAADAEQFDKRAKKVVAQYNAYTVLDTMHINGNLTLGENLADFGGVAIAYEAFKKTPQGKSNATIDGFTPDQRFFLSWAQIWRANTRPEELANRIVTDPHSPSEQRCNGPLSNFTPWYKAFDIKSSDKMYRPEADRVMIW